ncbi:MAG: ribonuclease PH [Nitrospirae bacterium]|nr:ribonuclease PH [Nitrospirota bacterium]
MPQDKTIILRIDGRRWNELRLIRITRNFIKHAEGSALIEMGETKVLCTATIENKVPPFLHGKGTGWVTAEYSMLPRSAQQRIPRESSRGKIGGRTHEIQRLIGRALRSVIDLPALGERTIWVDCDVLQADGGTRTASITGAFVALVDALRCLEKDGAIDRLPVRDYLAAVSVGKIDEREALDLSYAEDSTAGVDMNIVMTGSGKFVEIQGTAEGSVFSKDEMDKFIALAEKGIKEIIKIEKRLLGKLR